MRKTLAFIAVLVGLFASAYLTWAYTSSSNPMVCLGSGCDTVRESQYAHLWGLPLPIYGLAFYIWLALVMLAEARLPEYSRRIWRLLLIVSGGGLAFSAWLTYLEARVIHAWCEWCVTQAIAIAVAFLMTLWIVLKPGKEPVTAAVQEGEGQEVPTLATRTRGTDALRTRLAVLLVAVVIGAPALLLLINREKNLKRVDAPIPEQIVGSPTLIRPDSHIIGPADAPLTIVEFGDFQCPSCGVAEKTNEQIRDQYGKKVRFVFRQFPLEDIHQFAYQSAKASECAAEQGKFWPMAEMLYSRQSDLTAPALKTYAKEQGLDQAKFDSCLDGQEPAVTARIKQDKADGLALGVRGTPTFFLNGKIVVGPLTFLDVEAALSEAKKQQNAQNPTPAEKPASGTPETKTAVPATTPAPANAPKEQPKSKPATQTQSGGSLANPMGISLETKNRLNALAAQQSQSSAFVPCGVNDAPVQDPPMIHVADTKKLLDDKSAVFVDVRGASAYKQGHIPTAMNATVDQLQKKIPPELSKTKQIVLYEAGGADESCATSRTAGRILMQNGFKEVKVFKEGLEGWKKQGLPLAQ